MLFSLSNKYQIRCKNLFVITFFHKVPMFFRVVITLLLILIYLSNAKEKKRNLNLNYSYLAD